MTERSASTNTHHYSVKGLLVEATFMMCILKNVINSLSLSSDVSSNAFTKNSTGMISFKSTEIESFSFTGILVTYLLNYFSKLRVRLCNYCAFTTFHIAALVIRIYNRATKLMSLVWLSYSASCGVYKIIEIRVII